MNGDQQNAFWTGEVAGMLDIKPITVRSWALLFEKNGYRFIRDENNRRAFTERDVMMFKQFQSLTQQGKMKQDDALLAVISRFPLQNNDDITLPVMASDRRYDERYDIQLAIQQASEQFWNRYEQERVEDRRIMQDLRNELAEARGEITELKEVMQQLATTREEQRKRKKWWPFR